MLQDTLNRLYREYNFEERVLFDPIEFPRRYRNREDIEVAAFIATCFAYGRVELFKPVVRKILGVMGESPYAFLLNFRPGKQRDLFSGIRYRFNNTDDIVCLLHILHSELKEFKSIEALFREHYSDDDTDTGNGIIGLTDTLLRINTSPVYGADVKPRGLLQFFPSPAKGSACKRMNLFLRWMIRDKDIDFGIWKGLPTCKLIIPLDTHIARIAKCLGFTKRATQDWKMAVEITKALKQFDPEDPVKYDFALCHQGIARVCRRLRCKDCRFFGS